MTRLWVNYYGRQLTSFEEMSGGTGHKTAHGMGQTQRK